MRLTCFGEKCGNVVLYDYRYVSFFLNKNKNWTTRMTEQSHHMASYGVVVRILVGYVILSTTNDCAQKSSVKGK